MRYAQITPFEVCNGKGAGVSLFAQGCHFQCKGCFNQDAWDFNGGKEWNEEIENQFFELINRPYIKRVSILGGEPLADKNVSDVFNLIKKLKVTFPNKSIWLYTGYTWNQIFYPMATDDFNPERDRILDCRKRVVEMCDVIVDGRYIDELRDATIRFAGSKNQRLIDVKKSLKNSMVVLYE